LTRNNGVRARQSQNYARTKFVKIWQKMVKAIFFHLAITFKIVHKHPIFF